MKKGTRIFATASFRLAALYMLLFVGSIAVLGAAVFWITQSVLAQQARERIDMEVGALRSTFRARGLDELVADVRERGRVSGALNYRVENAAGQRLAGRLPSPGERRGWISLQARHMGIHRGDAKQDRVEARSVSLPGGVLLVVGDDHDRAHDLSEAIIDAFQWAFSITLLLGVTSGLILSLGFLRRVDAIARTAEAIIDGDLTRRVPERHTRDELDRLAHTFNRMLDRITILMEGLRQVSNDIAHDLRTPLTRLRQGLEQARGGVQSAADYRRAIDAAVAETDKLLDTFGALLRIAQIEAGTRRTGFRDLDLGVLIKTVAEAFAPSAADAGQQLAVSAAPACHIRGDLELLTQLLANLLDNAISHTPAGTRIDVRLETRRPRVRLVVADDGPGVPTTEHERILRRFYRLERSRGTPGDGLGLSLVAAIVALHDGELTVADNNPGLRVIATFAIAPGRLPIASHANDA